MRAMVNMINMVVSDDIEHDATSLAELLTEVVEKHIPSIKVTNIVVLCDEGCDRLHI